MRDLLGQGTFGQVFKCVCVDDGEEDSGAIAIKVNCQEGAPSGAPAELGAGS